MRRLLCLCLPLLLAASCKKPAPPPPAPPAKPAAPAPPEVKLNCPPNTVQVRVPVLDGAQVYCRDRGGSTHGPYRRVDARGQTLIARTFRDGRFEGEVVVYDGGELRLKGRDQADFLHSFELVKPGASKAVDRFLQGELERASACEAREPCAHVAGVCPFGCDLAINAKHEERAKRWLTHYVGSCQYKCAPPTGKPRCVDGACVMGVH